MSVVRVAKVSANMPLVWIPASRLCVISSILVLTGRGGAGVAARAVVVAAIGGTGVAAAIGGAGVVAAVGRAGRVEGVAAIGAAERVGAGALLPTGLLGIFVWNVLPFFSHGCDSLHLKHQSLSRPSLRRPEGATSCASSDFRLRGGLDSCMQGGGCRFLQVAHLGLPSATHAS